MRCLKERFTCVLALLVLAATAAAQTKSQPPWQGTMQALGQQQESLQLVDTAFCTLDRYRRELDSLSLGPTPSPAAKVRHTQTIGQIGLALAPFFNYLILYKHLYFLATKSSDKADACAPLVILEYQWKIKQLVLEQVLIIQLEMDHLTPKEAATATELRMYLEELRRALMELTPNYCITDEVCDRIARLEPDCLSNDSLSSDDPSDE